MTEIDYDDEFDHPHHGIFFSKPDRERAQRAGQLQDGSPSEAGTASYLSRAM